MVKNAQQLSLQMQTFHALPAYEEELFPSPTPPAPAGAQAVPQGIATCYIAAAFMLVQITACC